MNKENKIKITSLLLGILFILCSCSPPTRRKALPGYLDTVFTDYLDTVCNIAIFSKSEEPLEKCKEYLVFADSEFSAENESATLYLLNNSQTNSISKDLSDAISIGDEFTKKHPEYFSIYLDDLIKLWNINGEPDSVPNNVEIKNALSNSEKINLGAVAKGYITDRLVDTLREDGVESALINLGGNTYAMGKKSNGQTWKIGIQDPKDENSIICSISAENLAIVTSGDYQRYAEIDGVRYHHIFDPKTGFPANSGIHSVTVICESATLADILSTSAFVAGIEEGNNLLKEYGAMGIFITKDTVYYSKELEGFFSKTSSSYKYKSI